MALFSFLKRNRTDDAPAAKAASADEVQRARTRARQRLIGAVVLLGIGIVAFPLVFETQPRPIAVDIPIEIPRRDAVAPLPAPVPRPKPAAQVEPPASAVVATEAVVEPAKDTPVAVVVPPAPEKPAAKAAPEAKPASAPADAVRAKALLEDKPVAKADEAGRFVVQVGAFAEASAARETRLKVEKLGLKTYTQVVETDNGKRIRVRVGPFPTREEADKAAGRIRSAGLPSAILGL